MEGQLTRFLHFDKQGAPARMATEQLTFSLLERRIEELPEHASYQVFSSRRAPWVLGIGIAACLLGLIVTALLLPRHMKADQRLGQCF